MNPTADPPPPPGNTRPRPPQPEVLRPALARLLRPLVRLAILGGVTFPMLADLLRGLYVEVARQDLLPDERSRTDSRISLLTGVHRKEIRRQRLPDVVPEPAAMTVSSQVVARWLGTPALTGTDGQPIALNRLGEAPSFEALVGAVTKDIRPRALLDSWLDQGIADLGADGRVRLQVAAFLPQEDQATRVFYLARNLHDHAAAAAANVLASGAPPFLERAVHYDGLSEAAAEALHTAAREAASAMLLEVNRRALAIADADDQAAAADPAGPARRHRVNLGTYVFAAEDAPDEA